MDGPQLNMLWSFIGEEKDHEKLIKEVDNPYSLPWAAAYVLGEVGGMPALSTVTGKLNKKELGMQYLYVRVAFHLIVRYLKILNQEEPSIETMDVKTGRVEKRPTREVASDMLERQLLRRKQADEYFTEVEPEMLMYLKRNLERLPEQIFPAPKQQLIQYLDYIPTL